MKFTTKLYIGFMIPSALLLGIGLYSIHGFQQIDRYISSIYDDRIVPLKQLKIVSDSYAVVTVSSMNKAIEGQLNRQTAIVAINQAMTEVDNNWRAYKTTHMTPEEAQLVQEVEQLLKRANPEIQNVIRELGNPRMKDLEDLDGSLYKTIDPLTEKLQQLIELQLTAAADKREQAQGIYYNILWFFIPFLLIALLIGSPLGLVIVRRAIILTLKASINQLVVSSTQIAAATEEQDRITVQQANSVQETTLTLDKLGSTSSASAERVKAVVIGAEQALTISDQGTATVQRNVQQMQQLKQKVMMIHGSVEQLKQQTEQIGAIASVVQDLTNQTNLLALNAAIEAVRVGDHGQGFGVVATEIRKLSDSSQQSTERINKLIAEIQLAIHTTERAAREGTNDVETGVKIATETSIAFAGLKEIIHEALSNFQQLSLNSQEQAVAINQIAQVMNELNQSSQETARGVSQTKQGTQQLNEVALNLQTMM